MHKKNILYINKDSVLGGSAKSLFLLLEKIKEIHNLSVILCQKGPFYNKLLKSKIPVYYISFRNWRQVKYIFKNIFAVFKLKRIIKKLKPDIVHANSYEVNPLMVLAVPKKIMRICHVRDMITSQKAKKFFLQRADIVIAISKAVKKQIRSVHNNIKVIYNGVDTAKANNAKDNLDQYIKLNKKGFKVGIIGNCEERKRQEDFIKAGMMLCSKYAGINNNTIGKKIDFSFLIIGNNKTPYCKKIKSMIKEYRKSFYFINYVDNIYSIIKGLDLIVIASKEEAFGRVAIEAMICKKPVIASDTGGIPEIIINKKTGLLFKVKDYKQLAEYILYLYNNKQKLLEFGIKGYKRAKKYFCLENYINSVKSLY